MIRNASHPLDDERNLIRALKSGQEEAWQYLHEQYRTELFYKALNVLDDAAEASDVVQELFIALWEKRSGITIETSLGAYLFHAIKNRSIDRLERIKVRQKHSRQFGYLNAETEDSRFQEDHRDLQFERLTLAIKDLSGDPSFNAFKLTVLEGRSGANAARELGLPSGRLRVQVSRFYKKLKLKLTGPK